MRSIHWQIPVLLMAVVLLYSPFLWNPIVFDDLPLFMVDSQGDQPVSHYRFQFTEIRSLPYATLAWSKAWFGLELLPFRVENLLLHAAVVSVLYLFLAKLFAAMNVGYGNTLNHKAYAFFAALIFALHPVAVYAVGYLVQRTIVMATLFSLLAMLAYLHGSIQQKRLWLWASVPFYYLAAFSKEHAIMLPAVLLAMTVLLHEDWLVRLRQRIGIFAALIVIALFVIAAKKGMFGTAYEIYAPEMLDVDSNLSYPLSILTQSWLFFKYAALWLFPNPRWMSVDMREPFAHALLSPYLLAFAVFLAWGGGAIWMLVKRGKLGLVGFAMLFPWLMYMTEFSVVRIQESFVLYRSYLWAIGACAILPLLLGRLDKHIVSAIVVVIALAMVPVSMDRLASFSHPLLLWDDAEKLVKNRQDLPGVYRIYYNRGTEWIKTGQYDLAVKDMNVAIKLHPEWPFSYNNLGSAYMEKGSWREAVEAFNRAIEIADRKKMGIDPKPFYGRAISYEKLGEIGRAKEDYRITCQVSKKGCEKL